MTRYTMNLFEGSQEELLLDRAKNKVLDRVEGASKVAYDGLALFLDARLARRKRNALVYVDLEVVAKRALDASWAVWLLAEGYEDIYREWVEFRLDFIEGGKDRLEFYERVIRGDVRLKCRVQSFCIRDRSEFYENFVLNPKVRFCGGVFGKGANKENFRVKFGKYPKECFIWDIWESAFRSLMDCIVCGKCIVRYMSNSEEKCLERHYFNMEYLLEYRDRGKCGICGVLMKRGSSVESFEKEPKAFVESAEKAAKAFAASFHKAKSFQKAAKISLEFSEKGVMVENFEDILLGRYLEEEPFIWANMEFICCSLRDCTLCGSCLNRYMRHGENCLMWTILIGNIYFNVSGEVMCAVCYGFVKCRFSVESLGQEEGFFYADAYMNFD